MNCALKRFAGGRAKELNANGTMQLERIEKDWRRKWEAEREAASPSPQENRASIGRKLGG